MAKVANMQALGEKNFLRADIIAKIIEANHQGYLYTCACPMYLKLVREFYECLEVTQDDDRGIILQTIVQVQPFSTNPFSKAISIASLVFQYSLFQPTHSQRPLSLLAQSSSGISLILIHMVTSRLMLTSRSLPSLPSHQLLAKIVLHNLWPTIRRTELVLKRVQFIYALCMRMPFCMFKHILSRMLEMRDDHSTGLPFACLVTKFCLQVVTDISTEPKMRVQDPLGSKTLMKSNAQLWHEGQDEAPQPPLVQFELPTRASSSQTAPPPPQYDTGFAQVMVVLSSLQRDVSSIQREVNSISTRVEQCQLDLQDCLQYHHPSHDDED